MHLSKIPIWYITTVYAKCCQQYLSNIPRAYFNPKAFELSISVQLKFAIATNIVSNIYRTINKFLPNTIIYFTR